MPSDNLELSPLEILQHLIRFDTTNPPGNEKACVLFIQKMLEDAGIETKLYALDENRPNLVAKLPGKGEAPPLLLYGHVDVVTTKGQKWTYPPFEGVVADGFIWGRGTLDMKGGISMMLSAMLKAKKDGVTPAGDVIFLVLSDEESNGVYGANYMVEEHPEVFEGVKYALGEFGGSNIQMAGHRFYLLQVAEKQICSLKLTVMGRGGHGSSVVPDNALRKAAKVIEQINAHRMPVHITPPVRAMVEGIAEELDFPLGMIFKLLLKPRFTDMLLDKLGAAGLALAPMFHNTVSATIIEGGSKINVIPSEITIQLDGRMLPGMKPEVMIAELRELIGYAEGDVRIDCMLYEEGPNAVDMGLFETLSGTLQDLDPVGKPIPFLLTAVTDGRHIARLGIQSYGFIPMRLPDDFEFFNMAHAEDERVPADSIAFGMEGIYRVIRDYQG